MASSLRPSLSLLLLLLAIINTPEVLGSPRQNQDDHSHNYHGRYRLRNLSLEGNRKVKSTHDYSGTVKKAADDLATGEDELDAFVDRLLTEETGSFDNNVPISDAADVPAPAPAEVDTEGTPEPSSSTFSIVPSAGREFLVSGAYWSTVWGANDCYHVDRYMTNAIYSDGCEVSYVQYKYFNGGTFYAGGQETNTGCPRKDYLDVEIEGEICDDGQPGYCTIKVHMEDGSTVTCNECSHEIHNYFTMADCSNLGDIFPVDRLQTVRLFYDTDGGYTTSDDEYFVLSHDEDKCSHPCGPESVVSSSLVPSIVPSGREFLYGGAYDSTVWLPWPNDCYHVDRYMYNDIYSDGCEVSYVQYKYFNGGTFYAGGEETDTGCPREDYLEVEIEGEICDDGQPGNCNIKVHMEDGSTVTCNECSHNTQNYFTMADCSNLGDIFPPGSQQIVLFYDTDGGYTTSKTEFFLLSRDEDKCSHPCGPESVAPSLGLVASLFPSLAPI